MTKNLGQVQALYIGTSAPQNKKMIWWDTAQNIHKVWDANTNDWIGLALNAIIVVNTYSELVGIASTTGLILGQFYRVTDMNFLAFAISQTKVWYFDGNNIIVDDLGSNKRYSIMQDNLYLDDVQAEWDATNKIVVFTPIERTNQDIDVNNDYILMKTKDAGNNPKLGKTKVRNLLSSDANNSLKWINGIFFRFSDWITSILNQAGGIVGFNLFQQSQAVQNQAILALSTQINGIETVLPSTFDGDFTDSEVNAQAGDTFIQALAKLQTKWNQLWTVTRNVVKSKTTDGVNPLMELSLLNPSDMNGFLNWVGQNATLLLRGYNSQISLNPNGVNISSYSDYATEPTVATNIVSGNVKAALTVKNTFLSFADPPPKIYGLFAKANGYFGALIEKLQVAGLHLRTKVCKVPVGGIPLPYGHFLDAYDDIVFLETNPNNMPLYLPSALANQMLGKMFIVFLQADGGTTPYLQIMGNGSEIFFDLTNSSWSADPAFQITAPTFGMLFIVYINGYWYIKKI